MQIEQMLRYKNRYVMFDAINAAFFKNELPRIPIQYDSTLTAANAAARIYLPKDDTTDAIPVLLISEKPAVYFNRIEYYAELVAHEMCHYYSWLCAVKDTDIIENPDPWQLQYQRRQGPFQYHNKEFYISADKSGLANVETLPKEYRDLIDIMKKCYPGKYDDMILDEKTFQKMVDTIGFNACVSVNMDVLNEYLPRGNRA